MITPPDDDKVGYGHPPRNRRWKKGQSGNPRNKRKRQTTTLEIIDRLLLAPVMLTLDGETKAVSSLEAIVTQLQRREMSGSARASKILLKYKQFATRHMNKQLQLVFVDTEYTRAISNLGLGQSNGS
jgi:hypothetical protein